MRVADADRVDVRVKNDHFFAVADAPHDVAHFIETDFVKVQRCHFRGNAFADRFDVGVHAGDRANLTHKADDIFALRLDFFL